MYNLLFSNICENIHFENTIQLRIVDRVYLFDNILFQSLKENIIRKNIEVITSFIYNSYYQKNNYSFKINIDKTDFIKGIKLANNSKKRVEKNWIIDHLNPDGSIIAKKSDRRLFLYPSQYLQQNYSNNYPEVGNKVKFNHSKGYTDDKFYYINCNNINNSFPEHLIRVYFNINPLNCSKLVKLITERLNQLNSIFKLKCLKNPNDYTRADSAVLYLDKRYFFQFKPILQDIIQEIKPYLKPEVPLFTLKLHDGVGFAENPPNPNESFGMSRCRLIAEGIWQAHENNLPKSEWTDFVIKYIESQGYNLDKFYLNPNSRFPYEF